MVKFKALKSFQDIHTKEIYKKNIVIDMTIKRAEEVEKNLGGSYLVRVDESDKKKSR